MSIGIWELALILLFLVVAAGVVALITRVSHGKDVSHHTPDNPHSHDRRP